MRPKHPGVRVTVKRMSTAHIVVLSIAPGAGSVIASLPGAAAKQAERPAHARQTGMPVSALRGNAVANDNIFEHRTSTRSESVNGVRPGVAILTTAQK
jgi:hypothetical protein